MRVRGHNLSALPLAQRNGISSIEIEHHSTPMQVLALVNQKGGCGKTTTAVNFAAALAAKGRRVLLVDLDPQAHATMALGWAVGDEPILLEVLEGVVAIEDAVVSAPGGFWLLPASDDVAEFEESSARILNPECRLRETLRACQMEFDEVVLDCPPRVDGVLAMNALRACDVALLVVETGAFALQGAVKAMEVLKELQRDSRVEFETRVVATLFDRRTTFARELLVAMHMRFADKMFNAVIRTSVRLREAAAMGVPVRLLDPASRGAEDFESMADEWMFSVSPAVARLQSNTRRESYQEDSGTWPANPIPSTPDGQIWNLNQ